MKAIVYTGPEQLDLREVADPVAGEGEELVRITHSGICGSDMHAYLGHDDRRPAPLILGHEAAGIITGGPRDGQGVTINPLIGCGTCVECRLGRENLCPERKIISMPPREGAFAEYVAVPASSLVEVPVGFSLAKAALAEPLACGWHAVRLAYNALLRPEPAENATCMVIGGGPIGVGAALALGSHDWTSGVLVEPNPIRRAYFAERDDDKFFADLEVVTEQELGDRRFDVIIDAVGIDATRKLAVQAARPGAVIVHVGLGGGSGGLDIRHMTLQEISFIGTYTYTQQDFRDTAQAMFDGILGPLDWVELRPLVEAPQAFKDLRAGVVPAPKIILTP